MCFCEHKWSEYPLIQGNPLEVLGCQLRDYTLVVSALPVDSSILGVADHHSRCFKGVGTLLVLVGNMTKPLFHRWLLNPPFWHVFIRPHGIHQTLKCESWLVGHVGITLSFMLYQNTGLN